MKINALAFVLTIAAVIFALFTVGGSAHAAIPADLLEVQPTASLVNAHRAKVAQEENERQIICHSYILNGHGRSEILIEDCSAKKTSFVKKTVHNVDITVFMMNTPTK